VYGMNFDHMPELHWRYGYEIIVGFTMVLCAVVYWRLKKNKYL
jgi:magnesium transporter